MSSLKIGFMEAPAPWLVRQEAQTALGLLYLATVVEKEGYRVKMLKPKKKEDLNELLDCDVVCMGGTTLEHLMNVECAYYLKSKRHDIKIFVGGAHAIAYPEGTLNEYVFDSVCVGEGEKIILDMINDFISGNLKFLYVEKDPMNINDIPIPNRSLISGSHGGEIFIDYKNYIGQGSENFITSRGCHFNCSFCASKSIWNGKVRYRSLDNIEEELIYISTISRTRQLRICDDNLISNRERLNKICSLLKRYGFVWRCSARAESLSLEVCKTMYNGGCREVSVGIESGDQRVLDFLNKKTKVDRMMEGCKNAKDAGICVRALFMIGTPGEQEDTPEINRDYISKLAFDLITLSTFIPLPGTDVWNNPGKFECDLLSKDFSKYNKDYYQSDKVREYTPLIRNRILGLDKQVSNVSRMEKYVCNTGAYNKG